MYVAATHHCRQVPAGHVVSFAFRETNDVQERRGKKATANRIGLAVSYHFRGRSQRSQNTNLT